MKTIEVKIYYFNELTTEAKKVAIEQFRKMKYEDYSVVQWAIDNCYLFEPENAVMETLFGEEYTKLTTPVIANTRKNIYFDTDRNRHLDVHQAIEITNEKMFLTWLEIPEELQDKLFYTITKTYGRNPDTIIEFEEGENDYQFTEEENKILENAANKFSEHMEEVLNRIEESIEYQFTEECITEDIIANEYEYTADGKQYF